MEILRLSIRIGVCVLSLQISRAWVLQELLERGLELYEEIRECRAAKRMKPSTKISKMDSLQDGTHGRK